MNEMVERVAIAIDAEMLNQGTEELDILDIAHAAIAAMREPTNEMIAAVKPSNESFSGQWRDFAEHDWRAMIDAVLRM